MSYKAKTIRTFTGARIFNESCEFYAALVFQEIIIDPKMSLFNVNEELGFYLQDYYQKGWVNNSVVFLEVDDIE